MTGLSLSLIRILLGLITGVLLWLIWQASAITTPEVESIKFRYFLTEHFFGSSSGPFGAANAGYTIISNWRGLLPLACLFGVLFSVLKPLPRFITWILSMLLAGLVAVYCFMAFQYIVPWGGPLIVLNCFYLCGTIIYLETEKIERNRNLAITMEERSEQERTRIARDLHDESLQSLSRVIHLIDEMQTELPGSSVPGEARRQLESCITGMRGVINNLHPAELKEFGLSASIEHLVSDLGNSTGFKTFFEDGWDNIRLSPFQELCIYRIIQEALNNIEKHANATQLAVSLQRAGKSLLVKVADDGKGIRPEKKNSMGLQNMSHRAQLIGGQVEWKTPEQFSGGCLLVLKVPLDLRSGQSADASQTSQANKNTKE